MKKKTILVVEDDPQMRKLLVMALEDEKFKEIECENGKSSISLGASVKPDIILLDLFLPDMNGREVITAMREWSNAPIIILSVNASDSNVIELLNHGADDYIIKPFNIEVLQARINLALRKSTKHEVGEPELRNGLLRLDLANHQVFLGDELVALTPTEFNLLKFFISHTGKMLGHREILREVWGPAHSDDTQYLRVFVGQLREKLENDPSSPVIITTEPGVGYRMEFLPDVPIHKDSALA